MVIEGLDALKTRLDGLAAKSAAKDNGSVVVGYRGVGYAIYVHENVEMKLKGLPRPSGRGRYWDPPGSGPKFLENPAREMANSGEINRMVNGIYQSTGSIMEGLVAVGQRLQAESQRRVPEEFGKLKGSAFTAKEP